LSRWGLNISREGDTTTSLGTLFQCSITVKVKQFFLVFSWNFLCFSFFYFNPNATKNEGMIVMLFAPDSLNTNMNTKLSAT